MKKLALTFSFFICFFVVSTLKGQDKNKVIEEVFIKWSSLSSGQADESLKLQMENILGTKTKKIFLKDSIASVLQTKKKFKVYEVLHGEQKCFYSSGTIIKSIRNFEYGRLHGAQKFFHKNGIKASEYAISYGDTLDGKEWDWNGKLMLERAQIQEGYQLTLYKNGIKEGIYNYDKSNKYLSGPANEYYPDGTIKCEKNFSSGVLNGIYKHYFPDGAIDSIITFKDSLRHGEALVHHKNGKIKERSIYSYGELHGLYIRYYTNEKEEEEINFVHGKKHGIDKKYLPNGSPLSETTFENGVENGIYKIYHKNVESVMESGLFVDGYKHGDVDFYSIDGKKVATVKYNYGKRVAESNY